MNSTLPIFNTGSLSGRTISNKQHIPLAERLRPQSWEDFAGLDSVDKNLARQLIEQKSRPQSLILWGPAGCGKTSFAKLYGKSFSFSFIEFSAVLGGVKELREIFEQAAKLSEPTILFIDEIHRFNKSQQDAFLPHVESGRIILIGATTENPSFYLNSALLSRSKVLTFQSLQAESMQSVVSRAEKELSVTFTEDASKLLIEASAGDARRLLNYIDSVYSAEKRQVYDSESVKKLLTGNVSTYYDRSGDEHYNVISAFIKSLRGSNADAALYWGFRMIEAGEDPLFVIRRMIVFASEDIGNSDPRALQIATATLQAFEAVGLPEGKIPLAQCIAYLATAPKSNRSYIAMRAAIDAIKKTPSVSVPMHLRNAPTKLMKDLGYGDNYKYAHDYSPSELKDVEYLPQQLKDQKFYIPSDRGYEKTISERLNFIKSQAENKK